MQSRGLRFGGREVSHSIDTTDAENKSTTRRAKNCSAYTRQSRPNFENAPVYTYTCSPDRCVCIHHVIRLSHHLSAVQNGGGGGGGDRLPTSYITRYRFAYITCWNSPVLICSAIQGYLKSSNGLPNSWVI